MYKNKRFTLKGLVEGVPNVADKDKIIEQEDVVQLLNNQDERIQELLSCNHGLAQKQIRMFDKLIQLEKENKDLRCTIESNSQDDYIDYLEKQNERLKERITELTTNDKIVFIR